MSAIAAPKAPSPITRSLIALSLLTGSAFAHQLHAEARLDGGEVLLEVYFSDGGTPAGAKVEVRRSASDELLAEGLTDEAGRFRWRPPGPGSYRLDVSEPGLHRARAEVVVAGEAAGAAVVSATPAPPSPAGTPPSASSPPAERGATPWTGIVGGLGIIAALAAALALLQRRAGGSGGEAPSITAPRITDRARVLGAGALLMGVAALARLETVALGLGVALALLVLTRTCPRRALRGLRPLLVVLVPLLLLTPLHAPPGSRLLVPDWTWGPTDVGTRFAAAVGLRVITLGLLAIVLLGDLPVERTCAALSRLGVPSTLTHVALLAHRYAATFRVDMSRIRWALAARGFRPRADLETTRAYATVTGSLLLRSLARTERVEQAMRCRGYAGRLVLEPPPPTGWRDALVVLAALLVVAGLHLIERVVA